MIAPRKCIGGPLDGRILEIDDIYDIKLYFKSLGGGAHVYELEAQSPLEVCYYWKGVIPIWQAKGVVRDLPL
jgi:hypothetical protein